MNAIKTRLIINRFSSRKDRSLSLSAETPELTEVEMVAFMKLQGHEIDAFLKPSEGLTDIIEVKSEVDTKTPSQRLRSTLFVLWKQMGEKESFSTFYEKYMYKIIESIKSKLD